MHLKFASGVVNRRLFSSSSRSARMALQLVIAIERREMCLLQDLRACRRALNLRERMVAALPDKQALSITNTE